MAIDGIWADFVDDQAKKYLRNWPFWIHFVDDRTKKNLVGWPFLTPFFLIFGRPIWHITNNFKMKRLIIDTETTGLPLNFDAPVTATGNWPHLVQIAWIIEDTESGLSTSSEYIIAPDWWKIPDGMKHGISNEDALEAGIGLGNAMESLSSDLVRCHEVVAHNIDFDIPILQHAFYELGMFDYFQKHRFICTQKMSTDILRIPLKKGKRGEGGYKWPSLAELATFCKVCPDGDYHDALVDARVCAECYRYLLTNYPDHFVQGYGYSKTFS